MRCLRKFSASSVAAAAMVAALLAVGTPVRADHAPASVVPGNRWVPVIINGVDAGGAVVEGDWGLYRPGHGALTIYGGAPVIEAPRTGYFPSAGVAPCYGRDERAPQRQPKPAESYHRSWTTDGGAPPAPADLPAVPGDPPSVIPAEPFTR